MDDTDAMVRRAFLLAMDAHKHQLYGDLPYLVHLFDVVRVLSDYDVRAPEIVCAAWLHDVLEDTAVKYYQVLECTNKTVAEIVYIVTDELGRNRKERKTKTLPKLRDKDYGTPARLVKLADWIANLEDAHKNKPETLQMYQKDWPELRSLLDSEPKGTVSEQMQDEIENLLKEPGGDLDGL